MEWTQRIVGAVCDNSFARDVYRVCQIRPKSLITSLSFLVHLLSLLAGVLPSFPTFLLPSVRPSFTPVFLPVAVPEIFIWAAIAQGLRDSPSGVKGHSPGRGLEGEVPQKLKQFADIVYRF